MSHLDAITHGAQQERGHEHAGQRSSQADHHVAPLVEPLRWEAERAHETRGSGTQRAMQREKREMEAIRRDPEVRMKP